MDKNPSLIIAEAACDLAAEVPSQTIATMVLFIADAPDLDAARTRVARALPHPHYQRLALGFIDRWCTVAPMVSPHEACIALTTACHADATRRANQSVELVWTGPEADAVPFRRTEQAILQVLDSATDRITLVSYAVYRIPRVSEALVRAAGRGVQINVIVETSDRLEGQSEYNTLQSLGADVAACSTVYYWPRETRPEAHGNHPGILHVKCVVADGRWLFLSSANLTEYAFTINMELGVLITGGSLPQQVEHHFDRLIGCRILMRP